MKRAVLALLAVIALFAGPSGMISQNKNTVQKAQKAVDPVCGLTVEKLPELSYSYKGETYYFCSKADLDTFKKTPDKYVRK